MKERPLGDQPELALAPRDGAKPSRRRTPPALDDRQPPARRLEAVRPVAAHDQRAGLGVVGVKLPRVHGVGRDGQVDGAPDAGEPGGAPVVREVRGDPRRRPDDRLRVGRDGDRPLATPVGADRPGGLAHERLPREPGVERVGARRQVILVGVAGAHQHLGMLPGEGKRGRVLEGGRSEPPGGGRRREVVVAEAVHVADAAEQVRPPWGADEHGGDGLLDPPVVKAPAGGPSPVGVPQVVRDPYAVARREDGVVRVVGVDLDVRDPVAVHRLRVGRGPVVPLGLSEEGGPRPAAVRAPEYLVQRAVVIPGPGEQRAGVLRVHRD